MPQQHRDWLRDTSDCPLEIGGGCTTLQGQKAMIPYSTCSTSVLQFFVRTFVIGGVTGIYSL